MVCWDVVLSVSKQNMPYKFISPGINGPKLAYYEDNIFIKDKMTKKTLNAIYVDLASGFCFDIISL